MAIKLVGVSRACQAACTAQSMQFCLPFSFSLQENVKTKHPQLLYESKLYKILQGGGKGLTLLVQLYC